MLEKTKKILKYKILTQDYPKVQPDMSLWVGNPLIDNAKCNGCGECVERCPSGAINWNKDSKSPSIDYDRCVFCLLCHDVCQVGAVDLVKEFQMARKEKQKLKYVPAGEGAHDTEVSLEELGMELQSKISKLYGRSLMIREVDAGSCNGCDLEINALTNPFNEIERFGINFVASPRHADMLLVTGICTRNMQEALLKTYHATPDPKLVVAVGACACSGGIFRDTYASGNGIDSIVPVDVYIRGCPPRPQTIIYGILKALDRLPYGKDRTCPVD